MTSTLNSPFFFQRDEDVKTGETQTSATCVLPPCPRESVSTQTDLHYDLHYEPGEQNATATGDDSQATAEDGFDNVAKYVTKGENVLLMQQGRLAQIVGMGGSCAQFVARGIRSESAPPSGRTGGRATANLHITDGHVCFREDHARDERREQRSEDEQDVRHRTMIFCTVFVISALIILDGCISLPRERRDASPLQVVAWAALLSTAPTFIQCTLKICCSLVKFFARPFLWRR
jgi:hypothetical protein